MSYILSLKEKKLLQTENFQSLGWVKFRPFKSRIASYHKSQLFFRTGERFKHSNKFYSQVYLFSDTFQKDGRDFQMKVFVKVPCRFIWASDRSKRVSIIVPTDFKFYTTVKVYDPLHLQMVKGLELHPDESYPVEKIARKAYWGKVYPHSREKYEEVYNRFTETEKANADVRILEKEVFEPDLNRKLDLENESRTDNTITSYDRRVDSNKNLNTVKKSKVQTQLDLAKEEMDRKHLELEKKLQEQIEEERSKFSENNTNGETIKVEEYFVDKDFEEISNEEIEVVNDNDEIEHNEEIEETVNEEDVVDVKSLLKNIMIANKEQDEIIEKEKKREYKPLTEPTPDTEEDYQDRRSKVSKEIISDEIDVAIDEDFVDDFKVDVGDEDFVKEYQDYDPIEFDEEFEDEEFDLEDEYE